MKMCAIHYPLAGKQVRLIKGRCFIAFGRANVEVGGILGRLKIGQQVIQTGKTLREPPHWIVYFENVAQNTYDLEIIEELLGAVTTTSLATHQGVIVPGQVAGQKGFQILIQSPASGDTVCNDFTAYGTSDELTYPVTGVISKGAVSVNGVTVQQPDAQGNWVITFAAVPSDTGYTMNVFNSIGTSNSSSNITVIGCPVII